MRSFKAANGQIGNNYLKLTQKLIPLRIACAGGRVPLDEDAADVPADGDDDEPKKKRMKTEPRFSDFAFTAKAKALVSELESIRAKDKTGALVWTDEGA